MQKPLKHLEGLHWVGKLSLQDADILAQHARISPKILETGAGGSTLIFSQCSNNITSIETDKRWINQTKIRLEYLGTDNCVRFFDTIDPALNQYYDLIFIDCLTESRYSNGIKAWKYLRPGGTLLFHDTTRRYHFKNVAALIENSLHSVETAYINMLASDGYPSNITKLVKVTENKDINWKFKENKEPWAYGEGRDIDLSKFWSY